MKKIKVGVIFGGISTEHSVSIVSGTSVIKNLNKYKYDIYPIYISKDGQWFEYTKPVDEIDVLNYNNEITELKLIDNIVSYLKKIDVVFPVLHGIYGEDGTIQGLLEILKRKYVGCGVLSSSLCMNKVYTKIIFDMAGINQANYIYIRKNGKKYTYIDEQFNESVCSLKEICDIVGTKLGFPVFVKPSNSGSSIGINKSNNYRELKKHIEYASKYDSEILIEENINGRELECAVLGNEDVKASCVGEIISAEEFYSFDAKYNNEESRVVIPADLSDDVSNEIRKTAIKAFKAVCGSGLSRVDFFLENDTGRIIINEINTLPGFTQISMYPKLWEQMELTYEKLLDELISLALH